MVKSRVREECQEFKVNLATGYRRLWKGREEEKVRGREGERSDRRASRKTACWRQGEGEKLLSKLVSCQCRPGSCLAGPSQGKIDGCLEKAEVTGLGKWTVSSLCDLQGKPSLEQGMLV